MTKTISPGIHITATAAIASVLALAAGADAAARGAGVHPEPLPVAAAQTARATYIVQARSAADAAVLVRAAGGRVISELPLIQGVGAELSDAEAAALRAEPGLRVHADVRVKSTAQASGDGAALKNANGMVTTAYPSLVRANELHARNITGAGVAIAVLDSGLARIPDHDLATRLVASADFTGNTPGTPVAADPSGHGTHVSSIAASGVLPKNSTLRHGVAPGARLVVVRALDAAGNGSYLDVIEGLQWIVARRAQYNIRVLNLSRSAPVQSHYWEDPLNQAVMAAWRAGIVVVVSAGNGGPAPMTIGVPGNVPYVITVGALTDNYTPTNGADDRLASFSATGPTHEGFVKPEVVAPGGHIAAAIPANSVIVTAFGTRMPKQGALMQMSGTSQAAAVVSGVAALLAQANPRLSPNDIKCRLMASARPARNANGTVAYSIFQQGAGLVDAVAANASTRTGCANVGMDVAADLANTVHYGGPANRNSSGVYYLMDPRAPQWGTPLQGDGYAWSGQFAGANGYAWSGQFAGANGYAWSGQFAGASGYAWSGQFAGASGYAWSGQFAGASGYAWSGQFAGANGYAWSGRSADTATRSWRQAYGWAATAGFVPGTPVSAAASIMSINFWVPQQ
jgi:serine protease AprX